jgi:hypothetical protein
MKDKTKVTREYMQDPGLWPHWPILPMKKELKGLDGEYGVVVCNGSERMHLRVYKADMFAFSECNVEQIANLPTEDFSSVDELIGAGWLVD